MIVSELNKKTRKFTGKWFILTILLGGAWALIFKFLFLDGNLSKEVLVEIQRYSLIIMSVLFSLFYFIFIWKKCGFLDFFVKRIHYDNKVKYFFIFVSLAVFLSILSYSVIYDIEELYNTVKEGVTRSERLSNLTFSLTFPGIWYFTHLNLLFTWLIADSLILAMLIVRYFFDKKYRERYKILLDNIVKEN
ncbi:hypothetical protein [Gallibacterium sp. AGMB14963]|uniref:hypothetical protein n=1 Tax=Gallibacterium faecale TaxID=3019086 RepID=UPI0022F19B8B|nr:hypothetical protein [Gallibacterium sp. AGMB14963]MDA3978393.1 hypothetical protein [Gallibacterium sp. AGMB14963]